MNQTPSLFAGAGRAVVNVAPCLPLDGFTAVHDDLHVRALVLKSHEKIVIVSVDITSLFPDTQEEMIEAICAITDVPRENVWLTLSHSFAGPHIWPSPKPGEQERPRPGHPPRSAEEIARCEALKEAYLAALKAAVTQAEESLRPAALGYGRGSCGVNASRNMLTGEGWWLGTDDEEPCDHSLHVLRVDGVDGSAMAVMFIYGLRSCVTSRVKTPDGGMLVSSDLGGNTCTYLEREFGEDFTALFLCGPCGDQEPRFKGCYETLDRFGAIKKVELGMAAYALLDAQAARLSDEVLKVYARIAPCDAATLAVGQKTVTCATKKMNRDMSQQKPLKTCAFEPEGEKTLTVYGLRLGDMELIGVQPELNGATAREIGAAVAVMVNGSDKCMPEAAAYETLKYQCQNSPYMAGAAETLRDTALSLLKCLKEGQ